MKPNFAEMSVPELRSYVLKNREDIDAIRALFNHPSLENKWIKMPPLYRDGVPIEENIRLAEEMFRQRLEPENESEFI
jgi:hypothetical protein